MFASPINRCNTAVSSSNPAVVARRSKGETSRHYRKQELLQASRGWQLHRWRPSRNATLPSFGSPTSVSSKTDFGRLRISAAFSSFESVPRAANVITPYQRLGECLVFLPRAGRKARAIIHFIGGAFIGAVPEVTYSLFIELLRQQDFLIIATPYNVTFEHVVAAKLVHQRFQKGRQSLTSGDCNLPGLSSKDITNLPVFSIGHSAGALLQLLIGCLPEEELPKANVVISFSNKPAADAVPYFEQLGPVTTQLAPLIASSPLLSISKGLTGESLKSFLDATSSIFPSYDKETLQSLQNFVEQLPLVLEQISKGASEFAPAPIENRKSIGRNYNVKNTLLVKYKVDAIDESNIIEDILKPAVQKLDGCLTTITVNGNHITPCVQDLRWEAGNVYTPLDAAAQLFRTLALSEIRETVASVTIWLEQFL